MLCLFMVWPITLNLLNSFTAIYILSWLSGRDVTFQTAGLQRCVCVLFVLLFLWLLFLSKNINIIYILFTLHTAQLCLIVIISIIYGRGIWGRCLLYTSTCRTCFTVHVCWSQFTITQTNRAVLHLNVKNTPTWILNNKFEVL